MSSNNGAAATGSANGAANGSPTNGAANGVANGSPAVAEERYAMEVRAEVLKCISATDGYRRGASDRLEIGHPAVDGAETSSETVAGKETVRIGGDLREEVTRGRNNRMARQESVFEQHLKLHGHGDMVLLGGAMNDVHLGGGFLAAGMSDDLTIGGGVRTTVPADLWLAGLIGMEEKFATGAADGALVELYGVAMEREYAFGAHAYGVAVFNGTLYTTTAAGFRPLFKVQTGVRNHVPGGGGGSGGSASAPAAPPAAAPPPVGILATAARAGRHYNDMARITDAAHVADAAVDAADARHLDVSDLLDDVMVIARTVDEGGSLDDSDELRRLEEIVGALDQIDETVDFRRMGVDEAAGPGVRNGADEVADVDWVHRVNGDEAGQQADEGAHANADEAARANDAPPAPPDEAPALLPPRFYRDGFIQALEDANGAATRRLQQLDANDPDVPALRAEIDARNLAISEVRAGRDPRQALRSAIANLNHTLGPGSVQAQNYQDLLNYFNGANIFDAANQNVPAYLDVSDLAAKWNTATDRYGAQLDAAQPRPGVVRTAEQMAQMEAAADVEGYLRQAYANLSAARDPRPELTRHATELEEAGFAQEAVILRVWADEYTLLLRNTPPPPGVAPPPALATTVLGRGEDAAAATWQRLLELREQADLNFQETASELAKGSDISPYGAHLRGQLAAQEAVLEIRDMGRRLLTPYLDEAGLEEMHHFADGGSRARGVNRPFDTRLRFVEAMEEARAAGDYDTVIYMQRSLENFDAYVARETQELANLLDSYHHWDGVPLPAHIDQDALAQAMSMQMADIQAQMIDAPMSEQAAYNYQFLGFNDSLEQVNAGRNPLIVIDQKIDMLRHSIEHLESDKHAELAAYEQFRRTLAEMMANPAYRGSPPVNPEFPPATGGFLDALASLRAGENSPAAERALASADDAVAELANLKLQEARRQLGLPPVEPGTAAQSRARLVALRDELIQNNGKWRQIWMLDQAIKSLDADATRLIEDAIKYAQSLPAGATDMPTDYSLYARHIPGQGDQLPDAEDAADLPRIGDGSEPPPLPPRTDDMYLLVEDPSGALDAGAVENDVHQLAVENGYEAIPGIERPPEVSEEDDLYSQIADNSRRVGDVDDSPPPVPPGRRAPDADDNYFEIRRTGTGAAASGNDGGGSWTARLKRWLQKLRQPAVEEDPYAVVQPAVRMSSKTAADGSEGAGGVRGWRPPETTDGGARPRKSADGVAWSGEQGPDPVYSYATTQANWHSRSGKTVQEADPDRFHRLKGPKEHMQIMVDDPAAGARYRVRISAAAQEMIDNDELELVVYTLSGKRLSPDEYDVIVAARPPSKPSTDIDDIIRHTRERTAARRQQALAGWVGNAGQASGRSEDLRPVLAGIPEGRTAVAPPPLPPGKPRFEEDYGDAVAGYFVAAAGDTNAGVDPTDASRPAGDLAAETARLEPTPVEPPTDTPTLSPPDEAAKEEALFVRPGDNAVAAEEPSDTNAVNTVLHAIEPEADTVNVRRLEAANDRPANDLAARNLALYGPQGGREAPEVVAWGDSRRAATASENGARGEWDSLDSAHKLADMVDADPDALTRIRAGELDGEFSAWLDQTTESDWNRLIDQLGDDDPWGELIQRYNVDDAATPNAADDAALGDEFVAGADEAATAGDEGAAAADEAAATVDEARDEAQQGMVREWGLQWVAYDQRTEEIAAEIVARRFGRPLTQGEQSEVNEYIRQIARQLAPDDPLAAEIERWEARVEVERLLRQGITDISAGRDPRPELAEQIELFEAYRFRDGGTGHDEAQILRDLSDEYTRLFDSTAIPEEAGVADEAVVVGSGAGGGAAAAQPDTTELKRSVLNTMAYYTTTNEEAARRIVADRFGRALRQDELPLVDTYLDQIAAQLPAGDPLLARIERLDAATAVEDGLRQAFSDLVDGVDPSIELTRYAESIEAMTFADGGTGYNEAQVLRDLVNQYNELANLVG